MTSGPLVLGPRTIIAWDFDGVLNRNIVDGRFLWAESFEEDTGQSLQTFTASIFGSDFDAVITGKEDLRDRVASWASAVGYAEGADRILDYWFEKDALPDPEMCTLMTELNARGFRQIIATNNEARRSTYIEKEMGFSSRAERLFSSGRMGLRKPDSAFFAHISEALNADPTDLLLIDDAAPNVDAARACGWQGFHFTEDTRGQLRAALGLSSNAD